MPDFSLTDSSGNEISISSLYGKPMVINFWATWCSYCKIEMPHFQKVYNELGNDVSFVMLNVTDGVRETREKAKKYFSDNNYNMPLFFDDSAKTGVATLGITGYPTTLFIDSQGNIAAYAAGMISEEKLRRGIELASQPSTEALNNQNSNPSWCTMNAEYTKITPENAKKIMDEFKAANDGSEFILLDVRTAEEFAEKHIEGALLIPDYELAKRAEAELPDKKQVILVYCRSGRRSEAAAKQLVALGYNHVYDFGGIIDWPYGTVSG